MTQCEKIINHINKHGSITPRTADKLYGIMRLASRINDLRSKGYDIVTITKKGKNRDGKATRYAEYRFAEKEK